MNSSKIQNAKLFYRRLPTSDPMYHTDTTQSNKKEDLTIIPRARMGYESIAHEAEGRMGY